MKGWVLRCHTLSTCHMLSLHRLAWIREIGKKRTMKFLGVLPCHYQRIFGTFVARYWDSALNPMRSADYVRYRNSGETEGYYYLEKKLWCDKRAISFARKHDDLKRMCSDLAVDSDVSAMGYNRRTTKNVRGGELIPIYWRLTDEFTNLWCIYREDHVLIERKNKK